MRYALRRQLPPTTGLYDQHCIYHHDEHQQHKLRDIRKTFLQHSTCQMQQIDRQQYISVNKIA